MRNAAFAIFRNFAFAFPLQVPNLKVDLHLTAAAEIAPKYIYIGDGLIFQVLKRHEIYFLLSA